MSPAMHPRWPAAFWVGLGVPLAISVAALWQWSRASSWSPGMAHGDDAGLYLGPLAQLTLLLGVAATTTSGAALWAMRRAAHRALHSRDALLQAFDRGRRWLPVFMVVQTLLVFAGLIGLLAFECGRAIDSARLSSSTMKLVLFAGLVALLLLWYAARIVWDTVRAAFRQHAGSPIVIMGRSLSRSQAPRLWAFVDEVARHSGGRLPDSVVVGLNEGFFVTEHPVMLSSGPRVADGRVLYLPLPYMAFLERTQVAAVVAHELGHFNGGDTRYGLHLTPIYRALTSSVLAVTNEQDEDDDGWRAWASAPVSLYGKWFLHSFDAAVQHWSRERELAADAFSSRVAGSEPTALALLRSAVLQPLVEEALVHNRQAPPDQREGVLATVRRLVAERGLPDPHEHLEDRQAHPLDTHPPLKLRLQALGVAITPELVARTRDARDTGLLATLGLEAH